VDGFLFDLGLSSYQLASRGRGFSYRSDSPLDMRINQANKISAEEIINNYSQEKLADIFYYYGEEKKARIIAKKISHRRQKEKISSTQQLVGVIASCFSQKGNRHPARKAFQALRIFVNNELENLTQVLELALKHLAIGGRIIVITYHSLEDRIVKQIFKKHGSSAIFNSSDKLSLSNFQIITKKPSTPTRQEIRENHRARSAKMRVIVRIM
jgi:16S rRNA (cytosine1402-N4)-methyltransferase